MTDMLEFTDRRVHARGTGMEVVRYERAGKWYVEVAENYGRQGLPTDRIHMSVRDAAVTAIKIGDRGGDIYLGLPGGRSFDRMVRQLDS